MQKTAYEPCPTTRDPTTKQVVSTTAPSIFQDTSIYFTSKNHEPTSSIYSELVYSTGLSFESTAKIIDITKSTTSIPTTTSTIIEHTSTLIIPLTSTTTIIPTTTIELSSTKKKLQLIALPQL